MSQQISSGIIISSSSLVIQSVKRQHSGLYKCEVINAKGETTSNEIKMRVKCELLVSFLHLVLFPRMLN